MAQLLCQEKIDYKVNSEHMLAGAIRKRRRKRGDKHGTEICILIINF